MQAWVRERGLQCSQAKFTKGALSLADNLSYAELKSKAHNCRVMLAWIAEACAEHTAAG